MSATRGVELGIRALPVLIEKAELSRVKDGDAPSARLSVPYLGGGSVLSLEAAELPLSPLG